jgi:hypothetical protein
MDITVRRYLTESALARNWIDDWHVGLSLAERNATNNPDKAFSTDPESAQGT